MIHQEFIKNCFEKNSTAYFCIQNDGFCISNVQSWGFTDKDTWIGEASHPLPFDENYKPKPAVPAMINAMLAA